MSREMAMAAPAGWVRPAEWGPIPTEPTPEPAPEPEVRPFPLDNLTEPA